MPATTASLIAESVGSMLRQTREELGLSLREVAEQTKIPEKYLGMFENDAHGDLVDDVYTKIYLKAYGKFLGFETSALIDHYRKERARHGIPVRGVETNPDRHPMREVANKALVVTPKLLQTAALAVAALALLGWFGYELKKIVAAPSITLSTPQDGFVTYDRSISVEGVTEKEVMLTINGKLVSPDDSGKFKDQLNLQEGLNTITITGTKKHSKGLTLARRVIVLPKAEAAINPNAPIVIEEIPSMPAATTTAPVAPKKTEPAVVKPAAEEVNTAPGATPTPTGSTTPAPATNTPTTTSPTPAPEPGSAPTPAPAATTAPAEPQPIPQPIPAPMPAPATN